LGFWAEYFWGMGGVLGGVLIPPLYSLLLATLQTTLAHQLTQLPADGRTIRPVMHPSHASPQSGEGQAAIMKWPQPANPT